MINYLILPPMLMNTAYFKESVQMSLNELTLACRVFNSECTEIKTISLGNNLYYSFNSDEILLDEDLLILSRLSFIYAIYINEKNQLKPVQKSPYYIDQNINTILKYTGKTNIQFTRLMINAAVLSSGFCKESRVRLLDPIFGKGTTLFESAVMGYDSFGIEINEKAVNESSIYLKKFFETEKIKHNYSNEKMNLPDKSISGRSHKFLYAKTKDEYKDESNHRKIQMICGDSAYADKYFKKDSFHVIVGDLPYGVAHGNVTGGEKKSSLTRNPSQLVSACLPAWKKVLVKNGVIVLAWNKFVLKRSELQNIFTDNGFIVFDDEIYTSFEHRVDQSIKRDIILAKKMG